MTESAIRDSAACDRHALNKIYLQFLITLSQTRYCHGNTCPSQ